MFAKHYSIIIIMSAKKVYFSAQKMSEHKLKYALTAKRVIIISFH